jgi:hypothetical protein
MSIGLVFSVISAASKMAAGEAAYQESLLTSFRIKEVDKKLQDVEAKNAALARQRETKMLQDINIGALNATGRELSGLTVDRILKRDEDVLGDDVKAIARMSLFRQLQADASAFAEIRSGRNQRAASTVNAFGTLVSGIENYKKTKAPKGGKD